MVNSGFNLTDVIKSISRHIKFILIISLLAAIGGAVFYFISPKKYEAKTEFILRNPLYGDRNNLYNYDTKFLDYFASEDDVNRVILFSGSDLVQNKVIKSLNLYSAYKIDTSNPKEMQQLLKKFDKSLNVMRTEYRDLTLSYTDVNQERAALIANECVNVLEETVSSFYKEMRMGIQESITEKLHEEDSTINSLTDTLARLRETYHIYDIISPSRHNLINGSMKESKQKDYGKAIELIQNFESIKDEIVADRAVKTTLANQYSTGINKNHFPLIKVITYAKTPATQKGLGAFATIIVCAFLGLFFSTVMVLIKDSVIYLNK